MPVLYRICHLISQRLQEGRWSPRPGWERREEVIKGRGNVIAYTRAKNGLFRRLERGGVPSVLELILALVSRCNSGLKWSKLQFLFFEILCILIE